MSARVAVVGGGITGLSAAWELERQGVDVVVFERSTRLGGKLQASEVPGLDFPLDDGADAFLARVPEALELCAELGIGELAHPAVGRAFVFARGALRPLPSSHLLGLPTDLEDLATTGLVSAEGLERARRDLDANDPPPAGDLSVGELVRGRLGDEICDHLVEPLLGGINAGEADLLSTAAVAPQIWSCAQAGGSLIRSAAEVRSRTVTSGDPVFATPTDGMAALPSRLGDQVRAEIRLSQDVGGLSVEGSRVLVDGEHFDGAIMATPADATAALLRDAAPDAARSLATIEFASVVMVTVVADASAVDHALDGSGFVVARTERTPITACSWGSSKWRHWDDGRHVVFRVSIGHDADPVDWCSLDDATLVGTAVSGLQDTMGIEVRPVGARVGRWARSFPQYRPGHLGLVADAHRATAEAGPIRLAGASLGGIGVPACIRQGRAAALDLVGGHA